MAVLTSMVCRLGHRLPGRAWMAWAAVLLMAVFASQAARADSRPSAEYQVKAVFLFNFAQFVDWPDTAFAAPDSPIVIGILGTDPFGAYLDELVRDESVGRHPLKVRRFRRVEDIGPCHILFVSASERGTLDRIVPLLKSRSILTVGDMDGFTKHGGVVRFTTEAGKIRLRVNLESAKDAHLTISSKILRPEMIVAPGGD